MFPTCRCFSSWSSSWLHRSTSTCLGCRRVQRYVGRGYRNHRPSWWEPPGWGSTPPATKNWKLPSACPLMSGWPSDTLNWLWHFNPGSQAACHTLGFRYVHRFWHNQDEKQSWLKVILSVFCSTDHLAAFTFYGRADFLHRQFLARLLSPNLRSESLSLWLRIFKCEVFSWKEGEWRVVKTLHFFTWVNLHLWS